jgi:protein-L-isoaspartate(D-aspartate) O-methyltransferase
MTQLLDLKPGDIVLEIGTGSGYQAAVLAKIVRKVYSIEIVKKLYKISTARLKALGFKNVVTRLGDGYAGWPDEAPFDGIIVTAAAPHIPPALIAQLKPGGVMVIPVGAQYSTQRLTVITKGSDGGLKMREVLPVLFVPFTGDH